MNAIIIRCFAAFFSIKMAFCSDHMMMKCLSISRKHMFIFSCQSWQKEIMSQAGQQVLILCCSVMKPQGHFDIEGSSGSLMILTFAPTCRRKEEKLSFGMNASHIPCTLCLDCENLLDVCMSKSGAQIVYRV